ncbi:MarR family winged helix-turn-helix transcriptional regulator [Nocardia kruczakiae]|uniref:MarR family winged helix-turn-helix transcriptional regulator n=1 Tax=Nocardia kruczakiae TaxID=261477 RepID=UPI0007C77F2D|nr:MarR family transcriptional regulator [Nocardia kruczakiae]
MTAREPDEPGAELDAQVHAVMRAAQALVGIAVRSLEEVENLLSMQQLRVLVIVATQGPINVNALADAVGIHPSNATRACDPLVARELLRRQESSTDRRQVQLAITEHGRHLLQSVMRRRHNAITRILAQMPPTHRGDFVGAMESFAAAAGEVVDDGLWQ